jgi:nitrogen-specific signal transduction histidine kinase
MLGLRKTTTKVTRADSDRLRRLQDRLEAMMSEARLLREGLEFLVNAHELAVRQLRLTRPRHRLQDLTRAHRVF